MPTLQNSYNSDHTLRVKDELFQTIHPEIRRHSPSCICLQTPQAPTFQVGSDLGKNRAQSRFLPAPLKRTDSLTASGHVR